MAFELAPGFIAEEHVAGADVIPPGSLMQESERDIAFYQQHFAKQEHLNFFAVDSPLGPVAVSLILSPDGQYRALFRTTNGGERLECAASAVANPFWRRLFGLGPSYDRILQTLSRSIPTSALKLSRNLSAPSALLAADERQVIRCYKIGVLYARPGQQTEAEIFANTHDAASPEYRSFLAMLGETITLKGWGGYRAGLNVTDDLTGTHSVYTRWQGYEVMFHVSTLLPLTPGSGPQLERKRHIGNDIVVIVFQEGDSPIQIRTFESKQNHVFVFVQPTPRGYRITTVRKEGVPPFPPQLPPDCELDSSAASREFFMSKVINAERAAYRGPDFAPKIARTRKALLREVAQRFIDG